MKSKSAVTGKYVTAKSAKAKPKEHYISDDYPARMLRKLVRMVEEINVYHPILNPGGTTPAVSKFIANIKKRMGWGRK